MAQTLEQAHHDVTSWQQVAAWLTLLWHRQGLPLGELMTVHARSIEQRMQIQHAHPAGSFDWAWQTAESFFELSAVLYERLQDAGVPAVALMNGLHAVRDTHRQLHHVVCPADLGLSA